MIVSDIDLVCKYRLDHSFSYAFVINAVNPRLEGIAVNPSSPTSKYIAYKTNMGVIRIVEISYCVDLREMG